MSQTVIPSGHPLADCSGLAVHTAVEPLPETGFLRLPQIIGHPKSGRPPVIPVSKSSWWAGVAAGKYPKPIKLGPRTTAWRVEDIRALIATGAA